MTALAPNARFERAIPVIEQPLPRTTSTTVVNAPRFAVFGLTLLTGLLFAALAGAPLAWDGSYFLFKTLDSRAPFAPPDRLLNVVIQLPTLLLSEVTTDFTILRMTFGLAYVAVPLLALLASWWIVRERASALFVWPALSVGLGLIPGLLFFVGADLQVLELVWPAFLWVVTGMSARFALLAVIASAALYVAHPASSLAFAALAIAALAMVPKAHDGRFRYLLAALSFALIATLRLITNGSGPIGSLAETVSPKSIALTFNGTTLLVLVSSWFVAVVTLILGATRRSRESDTAAVLRMFQWAGLVAAGLFGLLLARNPRTWSDALEFGHLAWVATVPFLVCAAIEARLFRADSVAAAGVIERAREHLVGGVGTVLMAVIIVQSAAFGNLTQELRQILGASLSPCISASSLGTLQGTALGHWSVATYSVVLQGRSPGHLVMSGDGCVATRLGQTAPLVDFDPSSDGVGWFDLGGVRGDPASGPACWYSLSRGWFGVERGWYADWWRWVDQRGVMRVFAQQPMTVTMYGDVKSLRQPDKAAFSLNGISQSAVTISRDGFQPLPPLAFPLAAGENVIEVAGEQPPASLANDARQLSVALENVTLIPSDGAAVCELQP